MSSSKRCARLGGTFKSVYRGFDEKRFNHSIEGFAVPVPSSPLAIVVEFRLDFAPQIGQKTQIDLMREVSNWQHVP